MDAGDFLQPKGAGSAVQLAKVCWPLCDLHHFKSFTFSYGFFGTQKPKGNLAKNKEKKMVKKVDVGQKKEKKTVKSVMIDGKVHIKFLIINVFYVF